MTVESAFTSSRPEVLEIWQKWTADVEAFGDRLEAIEQEFGRLVYRSNSGFFGLRVAGLEPTTEDIRGGALPGGLRLDKKQRPWRLVPAKRTYRGKELHAQWSKIRVAKPRYPGMPEEVLASADGFSSHIHTPGFEHVDGVVWCTWGTSAERVTGKLDDYGDTTRSAQFDPEIWTQRRLSEYYAMCEAKEETKA